MADYRDDGELALSYAPPRYPSPGWNDPATVRTVGVDGESVGWMVVQGSKALAFVPVPTIPNSHVDGWRIWVIQYLMRAAADRVDREDALDQIDDVLDLGDPFVMDNPAALLG